MEKHQIRTHHYIRTFERAIAAYNNREPFSRFLTQFYKANKQMGSSDRRMNSQYCYNYFRIGGALSHLLPVERLAIGEFLCETQSVLISVLKPEWSTKLAYSVTEKIKFIESIYGPFLADIFPDYLSLSATIEKDNFIISHFIQPDLFIRVKKGKLALVMRELRDLGIAFSNSSGQVLALPNGTKLQNIRNLQGLFEVQDWASQQTINQLSIQAGESWWDCCAASGGKSLMLLDREPNIKLLVSDVRLSILRNLDIRFQNAGIDTYYRKKILDLSRPIDHLLQEEFDGILVDAPCSGSGTWGRTPEMLTNFNPSAITTYAELQKKIVSQVVPFLKKGKTLTYITCSVFSKENEEVVQYLTENLPIKLLNSQIILGYQQKADTMFSATFVKL